MKASHRSTVRALSLGIVLVLATSGCRFLKKRAPVEEPAPGATPAMTAVPTAATAAPVPTAAPLGTAELNDLPTPQDYEEEVYEKITAKNQQAELTRLSKEIGD